MKTFAQYQPPTTADLTALKSETGLTGNEFAALLGLSDSRQWRKYTGGAEPREMSAALLFTLAARLELDEATVGRVIERMREIGGRFDWAEAARKADE